MSFLACPSRRRKLTRPSRVPLAFPTKSSQRPNATHAVRFSHARGGRLQREAPGPARGVGRGLAGARRSGPDVDASTSCRRLLAPHRRAKLGASNQFPSFPKGPALAHLRKVAKQRGGGQPGWDTRTWGRGGRTPETPGGPAPSFASRPRRAHAHSPAQVREDGRFYFSIKALCCSHTKAAKTRFSSSPLDTSKELS